VPHVQLAQPPDTSRRSNVRSKTRNGVAREGLRKRADVRAGYAHIDDRPRFLPRREL